MTEREASEDDRTPLSLSWLHPAGLPGLSLVNFLLRIVTLGIYGFWAKTEVRRRLWSAMRINGEPLTYTGTGMELFKGFLVVFGIVILPFFLLSVAAVVAFGPESPLLGLFQIAIYIAILALWGFAVYRAQRYRMSRTLWRGIRGKLEGNERAYAWTFFWTGLLIPVTLGLIIPWRSTRLQTMLVNDMRFGDRPFTFAASSAPLYKSFAVAWIAMLLLVILGTIGYGIMMGALMSGMSLEGLENLEDAESLSDIQYWIMGLTLVLLVLGYFGWLVVSAWYRAIQTNYFASHTRYEGATLKGTLTGRGLVHVAVTNFFIVLFSLGILTPVAQARAWRYIVENLAIEGDVPLDRIAQSAQDAISRGEGLAQAFDFDAV